jgi:outer membrane receptor for ferrienterochelin and colicin
LPGAEKDPYAGEIGSSEHRFNWLLGYNWNGFSATGTITYIGGAALDDQYLAGFGAAPESVKVGAKTYFDLQLGYQYKKANFYFGIDNLFNTSAPRADTNGLLGGNATTGAGTWADVYDAIGRRYYLGVRLTM